MRCILPSCVVRLWPAPLGSLPLPPSPVPMYRFPSGPKPSQPPLWFVNGSDHDIMVRRPAFATFGLADTVPRASTFVLEPV